MVRIGRCNSCGSYFPETLSRRENCRSCGGGVDHLDEDLGPIEHLPRILNISGLALIVIAMVLLIAEPVGSNGGGDALGPLVLIILSSLLFILSLATQRLLGRAAMARRRGTKVRSRRVRRGVPSGRKEGRNGQSESGKTVARKIR